MSFCPPMFSTSNQNILFDGLPVNPVQVAWFASMSVPISYKCAFKIRNSAALSYAAACCAQNTWNVSTKWRQSNRPHSARCSRFKPLSSADNPACFTRSWKHANTSRRCPCSIAESASTSSKFQSPSSSMAFCRTSINTWSEWEACSSSLIAPRITSIQGLVLHWQTAEIYKPELWEAPVYGTQKYH